MSSGSGRAPAALARTLIFILSPASTLLATYKMAAVMGGAPQHALDYALLIIFTMSFLWLSFAFWSGVLGFFVALLRLEAPGMERLTGPLSKAPLHVRTAILMPVRNEDPSRTIGSIEAMDEALTRLGLADSFHFFILSDTSKPNLWVEEELAWARLVARRAAGARIFYRRRPLNTGRKSGNIADFCERWGAGYELMIVLDADSLMDGETLVSLVKLMELNPKAGLIQVPTVPQGRSTVFGRIIQFASTAYSPMFTRGLAFWLGDEGTYWGHNAIMRTQVFAAHCGLPKRKGRAPFGGEILSHDVVEAALIRRAGYRVFIATDLEGSYEETPSNLIEYAKRDRRWCQGNIQHIPLLGARGLHPISRLQLFLGVAAYLTAPLWLLYVLLSLGNSAMEQIQGINYFAHAHALAPKWPIDASIEAIPLLQTVIGMLFIPRILSLVLLVLDNRRRRLHGGPIRAVMSAMVETILSTAFAPLLMLFQTRAVIETFTGQDAGWPTATREEGTVPWGEAFWVLLPHLVLGLALMSAAYFLAPDLVPWLAPVAIPLILATPLAVLSGSVRVGAGLRQLGLLLTPDEVDTSPLILRARALTDAAHREFGAADDPIHAVTCDPAAHAVHRLLLRHMPIEGAIDYTALGAARLKLGLAGNAPTLAPLTEPETMAILLDLDSVETLFARALAGPRSAPVEPVA